eukprot:6713566-Ditylum_brightwellii.AAC.1
MQMLRTVGKEDLSLTILQLMTKPRGIKRKHRQAKRMNQRANTPGMSRAITRTTVMMKRTMMTMRKKKCSQSQLMKMHSSSMN